MPARMHWRKSLRSLGGVVHGDVEACQRLNHKTLHFCCRNANKNAPKNVFTAKKSSERKNLLSLNLWPQQVDTICVQSPKLQASQNNTKKMQNTKYKIENEKCKIQNTKYRLIQSCGNQTNKQNLPKLRYFVLS